MPKRLSEQEKLQKELAKYLGKEVEEIPIENVLETSEESLQEGQAVINYFEKNGKGFVHAVCDTCKQDFAYAWNYSGIKSCSVECMSNKLESLGLKWRPERPQFLRWGHTVPAVVSSNALKAIRDLRENGEVKND